MIHIMFENLSDMKQIVFVEPFPSENKFCNNFIERKVYFILKHNYSVL